MDHVEAMSNITTETTNYMKIMGTPKMTLPQMENYLLSKNSAATKYAKLAKVYMVEGLVEGVRGDIAFAQSCLETGNFKFNGDVKEVQNNYSGIGTTGGGVTGHSFETPEIGVRAQIQHLKAYASEEPLVGVCVDPRFRYVKRKSAEYVEWLGIQENPEHRGWAAGANYGEKILVILDKISKLPSEKDTILYGRLKSDMNIREEASISEKCITTYKKGKLIEIVEICDNGWYRIRCEESQFGYAYVSNVKNRYVFIGKTLYTVKKGDTLWKIAEQYLGKGNSYSEIKKVNELKNNAITIGMQLLIP